MNRRARQRAGCRRYAATNAVQIAINGARRLSDADVGGHRLLLERALREFACGEQCPLHWSILADSANMAETLAGMGLGAGADAERVIDDAQRVLTAVYDRHAQRGTWTLYADEIDILGWLVRLYVVQLGACSYSEFESAYTATAERIRQAAAGNAAPGTRVVVGTVR